jgi:Tfp pilus assembly major pilin PilA
MDAKKRQKGITLIALVVTIVVLLILAGITISLVFGSNGVIQKAQDSKEQTKIGEMREKLEMAKVPVYADGNGSYKVQDYWGRIESEGLIADKTVDIIDNGDGTYEVTTTPGYVFEITVEPNKEIAENIIIGECIGKGENLSIGIRVVKKTTNSIEIEVVRAEGASNFKYSIKKQGEEYGAAEEKSETRHVFSGLTQGGIYTIKVETTKDGKQQIVEKTVQVGEIPLAIEGDVIWKIGQAEVRIYTNETGYQLEWQKNGISEGSWTREASGVKEKTITGLVNGDIIYARLYDGISSGKYANIEVRDDIVPTATIKLSGTAVEIGKPLTAEVVQTDNESGININQTKWVLNTEAGNIGIEASKYTGGTFAKTQETITIPTTTGGTYYLHVLTVDNAGNKKEIISSAVTIKSSIVGGEYNEGKGVNTPRYDENQMTPIKWNGSSWVKTAGNDPDWYDYTEKKWANAMTEDGSMWVWIPRYAYSITSGYHSSSTGNIDVEFMKGLTNETSTGRKSFDNVSGQGKWNIHPAFNYGTAVSGLWVAKFEASNGSGKIKVEPGVQSWRSVTVNNIYTSCLNYNKTLNSHMMKNDEWGAVAYLSKSRYGKSAEVDRNGNSSYYTGGGSGNAYVNNVGQSTTGTVYGAYDMSGGAWEYVAAYVDNGDSNLTSYGSSLVNGDAKVKNVYTRGNRK